MVHVNCGVRAAKGAYHWFAGTTCSLYLNDASYCCADVPVARRMCCGVCEGRKTIIIKQSKVYFDLMQSSRKRSRKTRGSHSSTIVGCMPNE